MPLRKDLSGRGAKVPLWTALPFPRPLLPLPDHVHTPRNGFGDLSIVRPQGGRAECANSDFLQVPP